MSKVNVIENGNLFKSNHQTLTNAVNTLGVMGKGIALLFKKDFNGMYVEYREKCQNGEVKLGEPYLYKPPGYKNKQHELFTWDNAQGEPFVDSSRKWVLNFPTKKHWRSPSDPEAIRKGLRYLHEHVDEWGIESLAVPALGCGEGGLSWEKVKPVLIEGLEGLGIDVELYAPLDANPRRG